MVTTSRRVIWEVAWVRCHVELLGFDCVPIGQGTCIWRVIDPGQARSTSQNATPDQMQCALSVLNLPELVYIYRTKHPGSLSQSMQDPFEYIQGTLAPSRGSLSHSFGPARTRVPGR